MAVCMSCKLAHRLLPLLMPRKLAEGIRKRRQVRPAPRRERYAGGAWRHLVQAGDRHGADQLPGKVQAVRDGFRELCP